MDISFRSVLLSLVFAGAFGILVLPRFQFFQNKFGPFFKAQIEAEFGHLDVSNEHQDKVCEIAKELNFNEPFQIKRMNWKGLQTFGYYNAFAYLTPFSGNYVFISEGFFSGLSPNERRFLIGHEIMHLKLGHLRNKIILIWALILLILLLSLFLFNPFINKKIVKNDKVFKAAKLGIKTAFLLLLFFIANLLNLAYSRYIEKEADLESVKILNSGSGAFEVFDRWKRDFHMRDNLCYGGIFLDHPACEERKEYISELTSNRKN